jgi:hypothetical protein
MAEYEKIGTGHAIGEFTKEDGIKDTVYESITGIVDLSLSGTLLTLVYKGEDLVEQTYSSDLGSLVDTTVTIIGITDVDPVSGNVTVSMSDGSSFTFNVGKLTVLMYPGSGTSLEYTDELGNVNTIDLTDVVKNAETLTVVTDFVSNDPSKVGAPIADYKDEDGNYVMINETVTSITQIVTEHPIATYKNEANEVQNISESDTFYMSSITSGSKNKIGEYTSETKAIYSVYETDTNMSTEVPADKQHKIGTYFPESGNTIDFYETLTSVSTIIRSGKEYSLYYINESGLEQITTFSLPDLEGSLNGTILNITNGVDNILLEWNNRK